MPARLGESGTIDMSAEREIDRAPAAETQGPVESSFGSVDRAAWPGAGATTDDAHTPTAAEQAPHRTGGRIMQRGWRSPLTRRILALNVLILVIPILGLLHLDQYRQSLIHSAHDALRIQGRAFSSSLGSTAAITSQEGEERLLPDITRSLMRVLFSGTGIRARIFAPDGALIADSFLLGEPSGQVQVVELPPPDDGSSLAFVGEFYDALINWLPGMGDLPRYREAAVQRGSDYEEVQQALLGESPGLVRVDADGRFVISVAVPVQRYRQVLGALLLTRDGADIAAEVRDRRRDVLLVFGIALAVTVLLSLYLASTIGRPIRRLAHAADLVRYGKGRKFEIPDFSHRNDEIGDLSGALREMTEALWARLDAIEGFAADVAHEIKNPLTSLRSAVETVARVEDPEQQRKLMSIILDDIQRMDRLISDISDASRLDAELSRAEGESVQVGRLLDALVEVHKATVDQDGPRFELTMSDRSPLVVTGLENRLGQVFRNLISNAISFSPKNGVIRLAAGREPGWIVITVSDDGPGMPQDKLEDVFDRFYSERPSGEKFGMHSGLGLPISRQIVEAHGGSIKAENRYDSQGRIVGARFLVRLPVNS